MEDNFHPFSEIEVDNLYRFTYLPQNVKGFWDKENMEIDIIYDSNNVDSQKIKNNNEIFCIKEIYQYYKEIVENLIKKKYIYNETYIEYLLNKYPVFWDNKKDIFDFLIMEQTPGENKDASFAKLRKDIAEELGF